MSEGFKEYTIYKIECKDPEIKHLYVGSTEIYETRVNVHKSECNNEKSNGYNIYVYQKMREFGGFDNWNIEILEKVVCRKADSRKLEEEYRVKLKADLNSKGCYTDEERAEYLENKKKVYKIREKERKMAELREKAKEYGDLSKFNLFPTG